MKKLAISMMALLAAVSAAAQTPEVSSTVNGAKLNFEAPLFGIRVKEAKPLFSMTSFAGFKAGVGIRLDAPGEMNDRAFYGSSNRHPSRWQVFRLGSLSGSHVMTTFVFPDILISSRISLQARYA